jgi:hypothetical protein
MTRIALIDGDILPYKIGFVTQVTEYFTEDGECHSTPGRAKKHIQTMRENGDEDFPDTVDAITEAEPVPHALRLVKNLLSGAKTATKADELRIFLSGDTNFRDKVATIQPYKGNRTSNKPLHWATIRKYLIEVHGAEVTKGYEADDALGIHSGEDRILCTIDKDLDMIPGEHYNWDKNLLYTISEQQGLYNFYNQLLKGDAIDNIQGCPGIGEKTAAIILNGLTTEEEMFRAVYEVYKKRIVNFDPYDAMVENGTLLYILRDPRFNWVPLLRREDL